MLPKVALPFKTNILAMFGLFIFTISFNSFKETIQWGRGEGDVGGA